MSDKVKADYDALGDAASRFSQESDRIRQIGGRLGHGVENLKRSGWIGKGADAFFKEVESSVFPAYRRLSEALKEASTILKALSKLLQDAEQEAAGFVKGTGGGSAAGGAAAGAGESAGGLGDAIASALGGAMGGAFGGAAAGAFAGGGDASGGGDYAGGAGAGAGDGGDLDSFPSTLEGLLQNALGSAGLQTNGNIIEIIIKKGQGMADTGNQYGTQGGGGSSGAGAGTGAVPPTETPKATPSTGGGGGGGSPDSSGMGGASKGASMVEGGSVGTPVGAGQAFWFGTTPGSRLSSPAVTGGGSSVPASQPAGGDALSLVAQLGATAGAAALGIVGKAVLGKGLKP